MPKSMNNSNAKSQLIKNQMKEYIKSASSKDFYEIKSHCKNLIVIPSMAVFFTSEKSALNSTTAIFNKLYKV